MAEKRERQKETPEQREARRAEELPCTVFVRNLPMSTGDEDLATKFTEFGALRYARVVKDKETGHSRGSAFLCYQSPDSVEALLSEAYPEFSPSRTSESCVSLLGRPLVISRAVDRDSAAKLSSSRPTCRAPTAGGASGSAKEDEKKDRRNLALARLGLEAGENGADVGDLNKTEVEKRKAAIAEKTARLKDTNFFVSRTRLSVRQLPNAVDEKKLRAEARKAGTTGDGKAAVVVQAKVVKDKTRVDAKGKPKSKGFGFVEFATHEQALAALTKMRDSSEIFGEGRRLLVEFSVENVKAVAKLRRSQAQGQQAGLKRKRGSGEAEDAPAPALKVRKLSLPKSKVTADGTAKEKPLEPTLQDSNSQKKKHDEKKQRKTFKRKPK